MSEPQRVEHDSFSWIDAYSEQWRDTDMYARVEVNPQFIEPIDDYTLEDFERWCQMQADQMILVKEIKRIKNRSDAYTLADLMLANADKMITLRKKYEY